MTAMCLARWPHQEFAHTSCMDLLATGEPTKTVVCANTGAGKTRMITDLIIETGARVALYTHRKMLLSQTSGVLTEAGIDHGIRAAGYEYNREHKVQLCSTQTIASRVLKGNEGVHQSDLVIIDEAHVQKSATMIDILERHDGAHVIGYTATPVDIGHIYSNIVQAGTTSELRECGALLLSEHYGCPEVDVSKITPGKNGDFSYNDIKKCWHPPVIFGNVLEHFQKLNPEHKATILFAPGVAESQYMAEHFYENGISAAHISGECIWIDGTTYEPTQENRDMLASLVEYGGVKVVCNRFVMREGINWPFLAHLIFATPFGSVCSYLQAGGRVLRNHPDLDRVSVQDHGGNWWRHGSLNADRNWTLNDTANIIRSERMTDIREKKEPEPITCYKCFRIRLSGAKCPYCGAMSHDKRRMVIQASGQLKQMAINQFKERKTDTVGDVQKKWDNQYFRAKRSRNKMNFNQAAALYARDNYWKWPPRNLRNMPKDPRDWFVPVCEVPRERLI